MHQHLHDENNAPNQTQGEQRPTDPQAHLRRGVEGAAAAA